jgi:hypothetical protein
MRLRQKTAVRNKSKILQHAIEFLEPRQLLTTVHGGDVFQYQDPAGNIDRVVLKGNITAELIGATVGPNNTVNLINLPGELNGVPVNGGLAGAAGTQLIGNITVTDPTVPAGSPQDNAAPVINALASNSAGDSYGLVVTPITTTVVVGTVTTTTTSNLVQLVTIDNTSAAATVVGELSGSIIAAAGANFVAPTGMNAGPVQVTAVTAAAFNPNSGLLYFVAVGGADNTPVLFTVNVNAGSRNAIQGSVAAIPGTFGSTPIVPSSIGAITFDSSGNLWAAGKIPAGNNELFVVNTTDTDTIANPLPVMIGNAAVTGTITGIAFQGGSTNTITALVNTGGTTAGEVLSINDTTGQAQDFGSLASGTALGNNPGDLEYNPTLTDPFTGTTGALVATDTGTHQLFYVFPTNRGGSAGATLYAIYVSQSDINASISVAQVATANSPMEPLNGTITLDTPSATIAGPSNIGTAVLGAVADVGGTAAQPTYEPFFGASVDQQFGVLPGSYSTLNAGLIVAPGQNIGNFLFGGTVLGNVSIGASIQTFYAGWLLTGNADGDTAGTISNPDNFTVAGDIRNLLVAGPIGTGPGNFSHTITTTTGTETITAPPTYITGFDMLVQGTIGQVQTLNPGVATTTGTTSTGASPIVGSINAYNLPSVTGLTSPQLQTEFDTSNDFGGFDQGELGTTQLPTGVFASIFDNNSFDTPQYLGSIDSTDIGQNNVAYVSGTYNASSIGNDVNFYAVPLMAGQTITVQLKGSIPDSLDLGVFSPSDALLASDYNSQDPSATQGQTLQFTASTPGVYRFAVTGFDNPMFYSDGGSAVGVVPYTLTIQGIGNLGIGAVVATGGFMDNTNSTNTPGIGVANGDFGGLITSGDALYAAGDTPPGTTNGSTNIVVGGGPIISNNAQTIAVSNGSLRVLSGTSMGIDEDSYAPEIAVPNGSVGLLQTTGAEDAGTVTDLGNLYFNEPTTGSPSVIGGSYQVVDVGTDGVVFDPTPPTGTYVPAGDLYANILADGSIGDIRAGNISAIAPSSIKVGVGGATGQTIGLIESEGDFGTLDLGGPHISVGLGGSVGYIMVPNDGLAAGTGHTFEIYRDNAFGGIEDTPFVYPAGAAAQVVDSSGNNVTFTPSQAVTFTSSSTTSSTSSSTSTNTTVTLAPPGAISLTLYGIEGDGGSAIINATSTESMTITAQNSGNGQQIHIGRVEVSGSGAPVVNYTITPGTTAITSGITQPGFDTYPGLQLESGPMLVPLTLSVTGGAPIDVLDTVVTTGAGSSALGDATSITNSTGGEMPYIIAASIGTLNVSGLLGTSENSSTGAAILPRDTLPSGGALSASPLAVYATPGGSVNIGDLQPFNQVKTGVLVEDGNVLAISGGTSIGNVIVLGSIGRLSAGNKGIIAPVAAINASAYSTPSVGGGSAAVPGRILTSNIGGGIAAGGAGTPVYGIFDNLAPNTATTTTVPTLTITTAASTNGVPGLYADLAVGSVTASGGANIYGDIIATTTVGSINLSGGGSIVDAKIGNILPPGGMATHFYAIPQVEPESPVIPYMNVTTAAALALSLQNEPNLPIYIPNNGSPVGKPVLDVGPISISGNGGIIGSSFLGSDQGMVSVPDGFGVINSYFQGVKSSYFAGITAGGYGIRDIYVQGLTDVGTFNATGSGQNVGTGNYSASVLFSDSGTMNTDTGITPNATNDLNAFFGTSASMPQIVGLTVTGEISNLQSLGALNLGSARAYEITATQPGINPGAFQFANSIGSIVTASIIDGVTIVTGKLGTFAPGGDVIDTSLSIAGTIKSIVLKANFTQGSSIIAAGNNGFIKKLVIDGNMDGTITANRKITTVNISGSFSGSIRASQINSVSMGQGLGTGTLTVYGNINKMVIGGNLASTGNDLIIYNKINTLQIDGNLNADISVASNLGKLIVGGSVTTGSTVTVGNILGVLRVAGDVQTGSTIQAKKIKRQLVKGAIDGTIIGFGAT